MLYWLVRLLGLIFFWSKLIPIKVIGREYLPKKGPIVIAANHIDSVDLVVIICHLPFTVYFMLKHDNNPLVRFLLTQLLKMFIVRRFGVANPTAFRKARNLLAEGKAVGIFPEGTRSGELQRAKSGVGLLVTINNVPVIPVSIDGTQGLLRRFWWEIPRAVFRRRPPISVVFGEPFIPNTEDRNYQAVADAIMIRIANGLPPQRRGYYAR